MQIERARLVVLVALVVSWAGVVACTRGNTARPSGAARRVVIVTCDTLRADRLGCYGYARPTSPNLDAFARETVVFDEATTTAPWTSPALSALMTGRLPDEIGVPGGNRYPLPADALTLAEIARDAGYATCAVVSNGILRKPPSNRGDVGLAQGFERYDDRMPVHEPNRDTIERLAPATTDAAIEWLAQRRSSGDDRFFLWVHFQDPHGPYTPPPEFLARVARPLSGEAPLPLGTTFSGKGQIPDYQIVGGERAPEAYRERYDGEIAFFDEHLGRLLAWLREAGWMRDTLVVFTADHGEALGEHDRWFCHGENTYREVVRVPLLVKFPEGRGALASETVDGLRRVRAPTTHLDLWPTVIEALGADARPNRGISLFSATLPPARMSERTLGLPGTRGRWTGHGDGRWDVVVEVGKPPMLFDLAQDPGETRDVASLHPDVLAELERRERDYLRSGTGPVLEGRELRGDPETERALRGLGYTNGAH